MFVQACREYEVIALEKSFISIKGKLSDTLDSCPLLNKWTKS